MAQDHYGSVYGPFWPFGLITVSTPGTPVPLTQNFTSQQSAFTPTGKSEYAVTFNQFWVEASSTNTGNIYLVAPGGNKTITNSVLFVLTPGQYIFINVPAVNRNVLGINDMIIDADTAGNSCWITGMVA
jgi:hypothetical protein